MGFLGVPFFFSGRGGGIISQPPPLSKTRFRQIVPSLTVIVWELCWRFFSSVFSFCKIKGYYLWKYRFYRLCVWNPASRLLEIGRKLIKWQWRHDFLTQGHRQILLTLFFLSSFCYWSKFHVNVITNSGVMTFSFCKRLTWNPDNGNTPVWDFVNICRLG